MIPVFDDCALLIVDVQEKLLAVMPEKVQEKMLKNIEILIELMNEIGASIFYTEQYPAGLGHTHPRLKAKLQNSMRVEKMSFSCLGESDFCEKVSPHIPQSLIVVGLEAHVCVLLTVLDLIAADEDEHLEIFVPIDGVASRDKLNWKNAIEQMSNLGIYTTNTETLVYQALEEAGTEEFKKFSALMR